MSYKSETMFALPYLWLLKMKWNFTNAIEDVESSLKVMEVLGAMEIGSASVA